ncbi:MAG: hypothetical protein KF835_00275 [Xanthobacteraceae bacterium]|nr:hypothetical protein [Xanthobacteraceae bacterium]
MADAIRWDLLANAGKGWPEAYQRGVETYYDNRARDVLNPGGPNLLQQLIGGTLPGIQQPAGGSILSRLLNLPEAPQQQQQRFDPNNPTPEQMATLMQSQRYAPVAMQVAAQNRAQANLDRQYQRDERRDAQTQQNWQADYKLRQDQFNRGDNPAGFEPDPNNPGDLRYRRGGPMDPNYIKAKQDAAPKPLSPGFQKAEDEILTDLQSLNTINGQLKRFGTMINEGKLNLGLYNNAKSQFQNYLGKSDDNSVNYADFKATLEKLRNDSLRLNKGVQTEGDAQRAWSELFANANDPKVVATRLEKIQEYNQQAATFKRNLIAQRRSDNRLPALDIDRVLGISPQGSQMPRVNTYQEMLKLQPGTVFIGPDGQQRVVPQR